jgi:hypothetical protein
VHRQKVLKNKKAISYWQKISRGGTGVGDLPVAENLLETLDSEIVVIWVEFIGEKVFLAEKLEFSVYYFEF